MLTVSVVTGTYNRLASLKKLVESVRWSVGKGLDYEIVLVDGGSTDGTIEWAKSQHDVVLIEQGELLGAVKAFNAGALAAKGKYVILANDDITFIDESIMTAVAFMEDNPEVGLGAFWQDRNNREMHVEYMPVVIDDKQSSAVYGQVCIVPKEYGDKAGWWGNYTRTYGGDNELSCQIYEMGLNIKAIPCACIHDGVISDELRKINSSHHTPGGHPDSVAFYQKWTRSDGLIGPTVSRVFTSRVVDRRIRVLYAPIFEQEIPIQYKTKRGMLDALKKVFLVEECDYIKQPLYLFDLANAWSPDIVFTQIQDAKNVNAQLIYELRKEHPKAIFVNWNGDFHPNNLFDRAYKDMMKQFHVAGFVTTSIENEYKLSNINWKYWQIGYEESTAKPDRHTPRHDVLFLGNCYNKERLILGRTLRGIRDANVGIYGNWPASLRPDGFNLYDIDAGAKLYKGCKLTVSDIFPGSKGFVSNRLFQAMSAGAFVLQQEIEGMTELLGLKNGEHLVTYKTFDELPSVINRWLKEDDARKHIAKKGQAYVREHHSFDNRVQELIGFIKELI